MGAEYVATPPPPGCRNGVDFRCRRTVLVESSDLPPVAGVRLWHGSIAPRDGPKATRCLCREKGGSRCLAFQFADGCWGPRAIVISVLSDEKIAVRQGAGGDPPQLPDTPDWDVGLLKATDGERCQSF